MPSLYAAFTTRTGEVPGRAVARHTLPHKTKWVYELLATHGDGHMHLAPIYSSWINQGESWFANIEHDVIARGVFTCVPDLKRKPLRYLRRYSELPRRVRWKCRDLSWHITP